MSYDNNRKDICPVLTHHKACPMSEKTKYLGCRQCPIHDRAEREKICNFYRGQRRAGVPW